MNSLNDEIRAQRIAEIAVADRERSAWLPGHHARDVLGKLRGFVRTMNQPLHGEERRMYGNERYRYKQILKLPEDLDNRLLPALSSETACPGARRIAASYEATKATFRRKLAAIGEYGCAHDWHECLQILDDFKFEVEHVIDEIQRSTESV